MLDNQPPDEVEVVIEWISVVSFVAWVLVGCEVGERWAGVILQVAHPNL